MKKHLKLTREEALKLHREMWSAMREALCDAPTQQNRELFKTTWCESHFPDNSITHHCFLCEYARFENGHNSMYYDSPTGVCCKACPIDWEYDNDNNFDFELDAACESDGGIDWRSCSISKILALNEIKEDES